MGIFSCRYLMVASLVGFYSVPLLKRLRPTVKQTSMTKVICNCVVFIILTSASPVLARMLGKRENILPNYWTENWFKVIVFRQRTVGITTFDLLGSCGRLDWLGNFYLVLSYNLIFAVATGLCLVTKFTSKVRKELFKR